MFIESRKSIKFRTRSKREGTQRNTNMIGKYTADIIKQRYQNNISHTIAINIFAVDFPSGSPSQGLLRWAPICNRTRVEGVTTVRSRERTGIASRDPGSRDTGERERYTLVIKIIKYLLNGSLAVNVYVLYSVIVSVSVSVNIYKCVDV